MILLELDKAVIGLLVVSPGSLEQSCHPYFGHVEFHYIMQQIKSLNTGIISNTGRVLPQTHTYAHVHSQFVFLVGSMELPKPRDWVARVVP